jgi:hypothetical protein
MESESGAKIAIRGKGSVKEGKGRSDAAHASNQEEDLHCLIMADTEEKVNKAKKLIHNVIETVSFPSHSKGPCLAEANMHQAASIPEGQNELKRNQLRELAALNGTLRDDENQACQNCGQIGHRKYDCPERQNYTASIICRVCGNAGHMARDCPDRQKGASWRNDGGMGGRPAEGRVGAGDGMDREYEVGFFPTLRIRGKMLTIYSNSCKSLVAAHPAAAHRLASRLALAPITTAPAMPSLGSAVQLVRRLLGDPGTRSLTARAAVVLPLLGLETTATEETTIRLVRAIMAAAVVAAAAARTMAIPQPLLLLPGAKRRARRPAIQAMPAMPADTELRRAWVPLPVCLLPLAH